MSAWSPTKKKKKNEISGYIVNKSYIKYSWSNVSFFKVNAVFFPCILTRQGDSARDTAAPPCGAGGAD